MEFCERFFVFPTYFLPHIPGSFFRFSFVFQLKIFLPVSKAIDLLLIPKFYRRLFYVYCPRFCGQLFKRAANLGAYYLSSSSIFLDSLTLRISSSRPYKVQDLLFIRKFVRRMKGSKRKIVNGQIV